MLLCHHYPGDLRNHGHRHPLGDPDDEQRPNYPPGASGPIDIHKSLVDQMSLLSISQEGSEGEGLATSTWLLLIIFGATLLIFGTGYVYHLKIRLPKRRVAREMDRIQRERNDRNTAFLERLMQNENNPPPV